MMDNIISELLDILKKHLPDHPEVWKEILSIVDRIDTEARRDIIRYARTKTQKSNGSYSK
jgi:hypothetical protein